MPRVAPAKSPKGQSLFQHPALNAVIAPPRLFVGTSGWDYPTWKPGFYPERTPRKQFLSFFGSQLNSCEVNYTFRTLPTPAQVEGWLMQTPPGFRFSFKAPQSITHFRRLRGCGAELDAFLRLLGPVAQAGRLGLVLFQLPPNFRRNDALLADFLALPELHASPPLAFEFRHESWFCPQTDAILQHAGAALCIAETEDFVTPDHHPSGTHASFRLRRTGGYSPRQLSGLVQRILPLTAGRDVYVYFKHEDAPTGALNARAFLRAASRRARTAIPRETA